MQSLPRRKTSGSGARKATRADSKEHNRRTILQLISHGETTRAEVARRTGLTRATVSTLVNELMEDGLVVETGVGESAGGKPPTLIGLADDGRDIIVVDLSHRPFRGSVFGLQGNPRFTPITGDGTTDPEADVAALIDRLVGLSRNRLLGVGVASPGIIDGDGMVIEAANLGWLRHPLGDLLSRRLGDVPVRVVNDAHAGALAARQLDQQNARGSDRAADHDLLFVRVTDGIGAGVILDGRLHLGAHRAAGEIGHSVIDPDGLNCRCGNRGCLETIASSSAIYAAATGGEPAPHDWTYHDLLTVAGEERTSATIRAAGRAIGIAASHLINALDVSAIALSTRPDDLGPPLAAALEDEVSKRVLSSLQSDLEFCVLDDPDLALRGAANAILNEHLRPGIPRS